MIRLFFFFLLLRAFSCADTVYDIRGSSPLLDSNMSQFLNTWRTDTLIPIQSGIYSNVIVNGNPERKRIALTFDDAPDEDNTDKLLDILDSHGVKAAFFMITGSMDEGNISVVKRTNDEGHLVLNHTLSHPRLSDLNESNIVYQLDHAAREIQSITGHYPLLYRPPYGSINPLVIESTNSHGLTTVLWSLDSLDWTLKDPNAVVENVISNVRNGDIILMHRNAISVASLSEMIEGLKNKGYLFERLDEMLGIRAYR